MDKDNKLNKHTTTTPAAQSAGQEAVALTDVDIARIGMRFGLGNVGSKPAGIRETIGFARAILKAAAPVNGGEREKPAPLYLTGRQLLEALDLIAPDRTTDPDQLDGKIALQMGDERCHSGIGLYAWDAEYPEEGSSFLAGERAADAQQVGGDARAKEVAALAPILRGMIEGGSYDDPAELYAADFEAPDGDVFVRRAADLLEEYAALTSPAKAGGDERDELMRLMTEYEGALQDGEGDEEVIAPARAALTAFLRPVLAALSADGGEPDRTKPGNCHKCGLPKVANPHPDAGKPIHVLDVGCPTECLPCTIGSRHAWAQQALKDRADAQRYRGLVTYFVSTDEDGYLRIMFETSRQGASHPPEDRKEWIDCDVDNAIAANQVKGDAS